MADFGINPGFKDCGKPVSRGVVGIVVGFVPQDEFRAGCADFGQAGGGCNQVLLELACTAAEKLVVDRTVVFLEECVGCKSCVECAECACDSESRIHFLQGDIIRCRSSVR